MLFGRKVITLTITITTWLADCQLAPDFHGQGSDGRVQDDLDIHSHIESITYLYLLFFSRSISSSSWKFSSFSFLSLELIKCASEIINTGEWPEVSTEQSKFILTPLLAILANVPGRGKMAFVCFSPEMSVSARAPREKSIRVSCKAFAKVRGPSGPMKMKSVVSNQRKLKNAPKNGCFIGIGRNHMKGSWTVALFEVTK